MMNRFFHSTIGDQPTGGGLNMLDYSPASWYDAQDVGSLTIIDNKVSQANDKSGNGNHAGQTNAAMRPLYGTNAISNNLSSFEITNAGGVGFETTNSIAIAEVIMVMAYQTGSESLFSDFSGIISTPVVSNNVPRIMGQSGASSLRNSGPELTGEVYKNNNVTATTTVLPLPLTVCGFRFTQTTQKWSLLKMDLFASRSFIGFAGEIVLFTNQLGSVDRTDIIDHLMTKWSIS